MKGKPIEAGCMALIIRHDMAPENVGRVVKVLGRAYKGFLPPNSPSNVTPLSVDMPRAWIISADDLTAIYIEGNTVTRWSTSQIGLFGSLMIRLDDDDPVENEKFSNPRELVKGH